MSRRRARKAASSGQSRTASPRGGVGRSRGNDAVSSRWRSLSRPSSDACALGSNNRAVCSLFVHAKYQPTGSPVRGRSPSRGGHHEGHRAGSLVLVVTSRPLEADVPGVAMLKATFAQQQLQRVGRTLGAGLLGDGNTVAQSRMQGSRAPGVIAEAKQRSSAAQASRRRLRALICHRRMTIATSTPRACTLRRNGRYVTQMRLVSSPQHRRGEMRTTWSKRSGSANHVIAASRSRSSSRGDPRNFRLVVTTLLRSTNHSSFSVEERRVCAQFFNCASRTRRVVARRRSACQMNRLPTSFTDNAMLSRSPSTFDALERREYATSATRSARKLHAIRSRQDGGRHHRSRRPDRSGAWSCWDLVSRDWGWRTSYHLVWRSSAWPHHMHAALVAALTRVSTRRVILSTSTDTPARTRSLPPTHSLLDRAPRSENNGGEMLAIFGAESLRSPWRTTNGITSTLHCRASMPHNRSASRIVA